MICLRQIFGVFATIAVAAIVGNALVQTYGNLWGGVFSLPAGFFIGIGGMYIFDD